MLTIGQDAPNFSCPDQDDQTVSLSDFKNQNIVIYFYPKDDTPGCTTEALDFTARVADFDDANTVILGVSKDSVKKHASFCEKHHLGITLLSDPNHEMIEAYGAWQEKSMYGKTYMGIQRSTILIDTQGKVAQMWPKVKVKGHADEVLKAVQELSKTTA